VSGAPSSKSLMCCGVRPSGPPADPSGKVRTAALVTSSLETAKGTNRGLPVGSVNVRLSVGGGGCLSGEHKEFHRLQALACLWSKANGLQL